MKKIYSTPTMLCVKLNTVNMMATSEFYKDNVSSISKGNSGDEIDAKGTSDVNLWDNEW
ncbi:MAG: hypothetical protein IKP36_06960 [Bacteroidaceae bacterium]|nr:hypothetical protein [Bacteroidaceae bacterium]